MSFKKLDILKAFAIVHIFETSKAIGDPATVAVLTDGAGFSVGISQFTDKSGSLEDVIREYLRLGGTVGAEDLKDFLANAKNKSPQAISARARNAKYRAALVAAGKTSLMRQAQENIAIKNYMNPSIRAAEGSGFSLPLSLAVIYDANNQGGYATVRDLVTVHRSDFTSDIAFEKAWITSFCAKRKHWLATRPKAIVHATVYRPDFFLGEIGRSNWNLNFPMTVHGHKLTAKDLPDTNSAEPQLSEGTQTVKTATDEEGVKTEQTSFSPQTIPQYIPKITEAKTWLGTLTGGSFLSVWAAQFAGLPDWSKVLFGVILGIAALGLIVTIWKHRGDVVGIVNKVIGINADPTQNNIQLFGDRERYRNAVDGKTEA